MKIFRASVLTLHGLPHYQAQYGPLTRRELAEHMNGATFLAMNVRDQKRSRYAPFKGSRQVLPSFLIVPDQDYPRLGATYRVIEGT
jgi:hypothetical protein